MPQSDLDTSRSSAQSEPAYLRSVFGANLRELSKSAPSIAQLCRDLRINRTQYNRYLSGEAFPRPDVLHQICTFFKVDARILLEPLADISNGDVTYTGGGSRIRAAIEEAGIAQVDAKKLVPGAYVMMRRSATDPEYLVVSLVSVRQEPDGSMQMFGVLTRTLAERVGLPTSIRERRMNGVFFQHPGGFSFLAIVRNMPIWDMGFLENAFMGNPNLFYGYSIVTQRFVAGGRLIEPVAFKRVGSTMRDMMAVRHVIGYTHISKMSQPVQQIFSKSDVTPT
ncbi:hypothetical protein [Celeribacter sp.]|uniref:hypothetical protein n=1 Tax=Celeribacter sp. TaxID=1890673 RepID=UPI003A934A83